MSSFDPQWFVAQTQPHSEAKATENLRRQGFDVYLPRYLKTVRHARKSRQIAAPLFPRYLFVGVDMAIQRWRSIQSTIGISHLVGNDGVPAQVQQSVLAQLREREDEKGFIKLDIRPRFSIGEKVRISAGVFADNLGFFDGSNDRDRVAILLDLLGRKVRVSLDADIIAAA